MKLLIIFSTVVACTYAAPTNELLHPSPVNPDVLVAIKPAEKITLITDPIEITKFKRETKQPLYPTVLPEVQQHHISKREYKEREIRDNNKPQHETKDSQYENLKISDLQKPQTLPLHFEESSLATAQHKRDIPVPLVPKYHHPEESSTENSRIESDIDEKIENVKDDKAKDKDHKRDINVSSVPKPYHSGVPLKDINEPDTKSLQIPQILENKQQHLSHQSNSHQIISRAENSTHNPVSHNVQTEDGSLSRPLHAPTQYDHKPNIHDDHLSAVKPFTQHPLARPHPVPVAELFVRDNGN